MSAGYEAALEEARIGFEQGGIPIGSALELDGRVIGRGHNLRIQEGDPTAHAEISCLRDAGRIRSYSPTTLYTTLAPCHLCTGAVLLFRIPKVVIGESTTFDGEGSLKKLLDAGVELSDLDDDEGRVMLTSFIERHPDLWSEDIGN